MFVCLKLITYNMNLRKHIAIQNSVYVLKRAKGAIA